VAEITRRRTGEFLRELFSILMAAPEGMRAEPVRIFVCEAVGKSGDQFSRAPA